MDLTELNNQLRNIIDRAPRPEKVLVTGGMPYANGPLHVGHLAGALVPPDIYARWSKMYVGNDNVLFVCGTDDHGSTSEVAAHKAGKPVRQFIDEIHALQKDTMERYRIGLDVYSGTSSPDNYPTHEAVCQDMLRKLYQNAMLEKVRSLQWFDPKMEQFLADRYVIGECPRCGHQRAYSDECDSCGANYDAQELINPVSTVSGDTPELRETDHWWLDMWKVLDTLKGWVESKSRTWRKLVYSEVMGQVTPSIIFSNQFEETFKEHKSALPSCKSRYAPGKKIVVAFDNLDDLAQGKRMLEEAGVELELDDGWAHRSITRDISWGIPVPPEIDEEMVGKTLYVWPDSLIAPVAFTQLALKKKGLAADDYRQYWCNPKAQISQFIGADNVFFYVIMQGSMWLGSQADIHRMPVEGELQMSDVFSNCHLLINGEKMSKSTGNYFTADELVQEHGFSADQIRYYLSGLSLHKKQSNFELEGLREKCSFLAGPMNAAFEKPISAALSKFDGKVPEGSLIEKTGEATVKMVATYQKLMARADYPDLIGHIENYARLINKLFSKHKPHDDRYPEKERADALYSAFFILKSLLIMLYPFVPETAERLRESLKLPESVYDIAQLGTQIEPGHEVGELAEYFPPEASE